MKNTLTFLFWIFISTSIFGQDFNLTFGAKSKFGDREYIVGTPFFDGESFYLYNYKGSLFSEFSFNKNKKVFLRKFDNALNPSSENRLSVKEKKMVDWGIKYRDGQMYWLLSKYSKSDKKLNIYFQIMDTKGKVSAVKKVASLPQRNKNEKTIAGWDFSQDRSKIIIVTESSKLNIDDLEDLFKVEYKDKVYDADVITLDSDLNLLSKANYQPGSLFLYNTVIDWLVSNDGNAFVAVKHYEEKVNYLSQRYFPFEDDINNDVQLFALPRGGKELKKLESISGDKIIKSIKLVQKDDNTICAAGYSGNSKKAKANYVFVTFFDPKTQTPSLHNVIEVPSQVIGELNVVSKQSNGLSNFVHAKNIEFFEDGSFSLIGETSYRVERVIKIFLDDPEDFDPTYHSDDKLIFTFDIDGSLLSFYTLPIRFHTNYKKNAGYVLVNTGEEVMLFYHDKMTAVEKGEFVKDKASHGGMFSAFAATLASFKDGKINRRFLIEGSKRNKAEISLNVVSSLSLDVDNTFLVFDFPITFNKRSIKIAAFDLL